MCISDPATEQCRSNDKIIRSRLLNRLGIFDGAACEPTTQHRRIRMLRNMGMGVGCSRSAPASSSSAAASSLLTCDRQRSLVSTVRTVEPLKYAHSQAGASSPDSSVSRRQDRTSPTKSKKQVSFRDTVAVVPIPMRTEYSARIRHRIWSCRNEIHENAQRNTIEFGAEGWDWRTVVLDEGMFVCSVSGELVHPVHCQQYYYQQIQMSSLPDESPILSRGEPVLGY